MSNSQPPQQPGLKSYATHDATSSQQPQNFGHPSPPGQQVPYSSVSQSPSGPSHPLPKQEYEQQQRQGQDYYSSSQQDPQAYISSRQQIPQTPPSPQNSQIPPSHQQYQQYCAQSQQPSQGQYYLQRSQPYFSPGHQFPQGTLYSPGSYQYRYGYQYPPTVQQYPYAQFPSSAKRTPMVRPGRRSDSGNEPQLEGWKSFDDKAVRRKFVRKVYTIIMLQLLFTLGIIALFVFEPNVKRFVHENRFVYFIAFAIFFGVYISLACFQSIRRTYPMNIILLIIFTMAMAFMLGTISSYHTTEAVFMAVGICATVCLLVSLFSFYSKFDFTSCGGILCILLLVLILFGLIAIFIPSRVMTMIYGAAGALVFTLFLAYDTQMMMGGKNYELSPEEHIFAAVQIYIDVVYIFMFLLLLTGGSE